MVSWLLVTLLTHLAGEIALGVGGTSCKRDFRSKENTSALRQGTWNSLAESGLFRNADKLQAILETSIYCDLPMV